MYREHLFTLAFYLQFGAIYLQLRQKKGTFFLTLVAVDGGDWEGLSTFMEYDPSSDRAS